MSSGSRVIRSRNKKILHGMSDFSKMLTTKDIDSESPVEVEVESVRPKLKHPLLNGQSMKLVWANDRGAFKSPTDNIFSPMTKKIEAKRSHLLKS